MEMLADRWLRRGFLETVGQRSVAATGASPAGSTTLWPVRPRHGYAYPQGGQCPVWSGQPPY
jgi:hypothetical protein